MTSLLYKGLIVQSVSCGYSHTLASTKNGKIFAWGCGSYGQLGLGDLDDRLKPTEI